LSLQFILTLRRGIKLLNKQAENYFYFLKKNTRYLLSFRFSEKELIERKFSA